MTKPQPLCPKRQLKLHLLKPPLQWWPLNQSSRWWRCAATIDLAKSEPKWPPPVGVANLATAVKAGVTVVPRTGVTEVVDPKTVLVIASVTALSGRTGVPVWVMRLSEPSVMHWVRPK